MRHDEHSSVNSIADVARRGGKVDWMAVAVRERLFDLEEGRAMLEYVSSYCVFSLLRNPWRDESRVQGILRGIGRQGGLSISTVLND